MREASRVPEKIWIMQNMFQDTCASGADSRGDKIKLVEVS